MRMFPGELVWLQEMKVVKLHKKKIDGQHASL
jgi:hypothetical protein